MGSKYYQNEARSETNPPGADLGFFVPQSKFFGRRGVIGAGRGLDWAWSTRGGEGGGEWALNNFYAESPPLDF